MPAYELRSGGDVKTKKQSVADLKYRRLTELNARLKEDLDRPRCEPGAADTILRQLEAYGLHWDGTVLYQSQRDDAYAAALEALKACGAVYPCACTRSQLAQVPRNHEGEILYPGTCRNGLPPGTIARAWRVRVADANFRFHDRIHGDLEQNLARDVGDFIISVKRI